MTTDKAKSPIGAVVNVFPDATHDMRVYAINRIESDHDAVEGTAETDARLATRSHSIGGDPRACLHPEPAPRALRARRRSNQRTCPCRRRVRRTRPSQLTRRPQRHRAHRPTPTQQSPMRHNRRHRRMSNPVVHGSSFGPGSLGSPNCWVSNAGLDEPEVHGSRAPRGLARRLLRNAATSR